MIKRQIIIVLLLAMGIGSVYGWPQKKIDGGVRLADLVDNKSYDLSEPVEIKADSIEKLLMIIDQDSQNYSCDESFTHNVILAFSQWCGKFVGPKLEYVVFRLPQYYERDTNFDIRSQSGDYYRNYEDYGDKIVYDPYVNQIAINDYLLRQNVVVFASQQHSHGACDVVLYAVIPYKDDFFMCRVSVDFGPKVRFEFFETDDNVLKGEIIGKRLPRYIKGNGVIDWYFFFYNMRWAYDRTYPISIQRIKLDPKKEKITLKSLFFKKK